MTPRNQLRATCTWLAIVLLLLVAGGAFAGTAAPVPTGPKMNGTWAVPDYNTTPNWAFSPQLTKFVDTLPGIGPQKANNLGQYLPVAVADKTSYPGSDYYIIELREYSERLHSELNPTRMRGYVQVDANGNDLSPIHYLGPVIVAERDRPVRIQFINRLPSGAGGDLFIPVDTSVMGAGKGPAYQGAARGEGADCDNTVDGNSCASYAQNRATIHLHGGRTPWISDGTPHQWITPADENTPYPQGVSVQNVPDMPNPGDGSMTFYYSNQQSARLMFYHDHAFGITRLNVYAGMAAGYLITDKHEQDLIARNILPPDQIPLVIQDRTFVDAPNIRSTDPLWNWGSGTPDAEGIRPPVTGDLWLPHVYMPAQNPYNPDFSGANPFGRWLYGPWFYPPTVVKHGPVPNPYYDADCMSPDPAVFVNCTTPGQPPFVPATPHPSMGMEAFLDTMMVNGTVFPVLEVDPRAYRFRILNAANDRGLNLSLYKADPAPAPSDLRRLSNLTEVKMVPSAPTPGWPALWPADGREGGVPDPGVLQGDGRYSNWGPSWIQIGTEGGFLPKPVVKDPLPVTYIMDPTAFAVGVVLDTSLALMPAERADVIVDFSNYAGQTLILYNDAPTAWPALDARYDYYTGAPDLRDVGGFGTGGTLDPVSGAWIGGTGPLPGKGPNTRTVMQIVVRSAASEPGLAFDKAALEREFTSSAPETALNPAPVKTLFERAQEPIIVGQARYKDAYPNLFFPTNWPWWGVRGSILERTLKFVTLSGEPVEIPLEPKGIHDEMGASFDPEYGRMSGNLSMELPNPTTNNANLILYGFSDIPTETVENSPEGTVRVSTTQLGTLADGTQIWNISHNGVDTHPIHFHIFDVQLVNRLAWDGQIYLPDENELGWKDTVRISPLMDTIVAVRPVAPKLPFGIPNSMRPLNPALPIGSTMGFSNIDWTTGEVYAPPSPYAGGVSNQLYNFKWEYVWHCHILSHEEMDMMRPIVLNVVNDAPGTPTGVAGTETAPASGTVTVQWTDPTPAADPATMGNITNEIGFRVERCAGETCTDFAPVGTALATATSFTDATTFTQALNRYKVVAYNAAGEMGSEATTVGITSLINGSCGSSSGVTLKALPTGNLCSFGAPAAVTEDLANWTWSWSCNGFNGGSDATCSAAIKTYRLIYTASGGFVSVTSQTVQHGTDAQTVTATGIAGNTFMAWVDASNNVVGTTPSLTITGVTADNVYTAVFSVAKDFNKDGNADILWSTGGGGSTVAWFMSATTNLTAPAKLGESQLTAGPGPGYNIAATGDFDLDGNTDILWRNQATGANVISYMNGVTKVGEATLLSNPAPWAVGGVGDFNGDKKPDILWRQSGGNRSNVWFMDGATRTGVSPNLPNLTAGWVVGGVADLNGDGQTDILWRSSTANTNNTFAWYMNGVNRIGVSRNLPNMAQPWTVAGLTDFDKDGKPDILWRNPSTNVLSIWYMNGVSRISTSPNITTGLAASWQVVGK